MSNNKHANKEKADNLAENEATEEALANLINSDDSKASGEYLDEGVDEEKEKLNAEIAELKDKILRQAAEFDNFRRRNAKEKVELTQTAGKDIIQSLLVVLDDMDRAGKQLDATSDLVLKEGILLVFNKLRNILQQRGLKAMEAVKVDFNPDLHEAITEIPVPEESMKGKVIDVVEPGYYLNDKLIRHAKVVVGK